MRILVASIPAALPAAQALARALATPLKRVCLCGLAIAVAPSARADWSQSGKVWASDYAPIGDIQNFGYCMSADGNRLAVGAPLMGWPWDDGEVYIYENVGGTWVEILTLLPPIPNGARFGISVALEGAVLVCGEVGSGTVWIFRESGGVWAQEAKLQAPDGFVLGGGFGSSVALEGDRLMIGAREATGATPRSGAVYEYRYIAGVWVFSAKIFALTGLPDDLFGVDVELEGTRMIVGASRRDVPGKGDCGAVFVFEHNVALWLEDQELVPEVGGDAADFGFRVSLSGDSLLAAARGEVNDTGAAYVFTTAGNGWQQEARLVDPHGATQNFFGNGVSLDGDRALVGAPAKHGVLPLTGAAFLFQRYGTSWALCAEFVADDTGKGDLFGTDVTQTADQLFVSATGDDPAGGDGGIVGTAYVFDEGPAQPPTNYCTAVANSSGSPGVMGWHGSTTVSDADFHLDATSLPQFQFGYFLASESAGFTANPGGSQGNLCLGSPIGRFASQVQGSGASGAITIQVNLDGMPSTLPTHAFPCQTFYFQCWFRDNNPGQTSNFTDGLAVTFQ